MTVVHIPTNQESIEWAARNREEQRRRHGPEPHEQAAETIAHLRYALEQARKEQARKEQDEWQAAMVDWTGPEATKALVAQRDAAQQDAKEARALLGEALPHCMSRALRARIEAMLEKKL